MLHLYCLLPSGDAPPAALRGADDEAVRAIPVAGMDVWVGDVGDAGAGTASVAQVKAHDAVLHAALDTGRTPLPFRFAQRLADETALRSDIESRAADLRRRLDELQGLVEMSAIVAVADPEAHAQPADAGSNATGAGARYLRTLRDRQRAEADASGRAEQALGAIGSALAGIVAATSLGRPAPATASAAHLVRVGNVDAYRRRAGAVTLPRGCRLVIAGPRAPYSFADPSELRLGTNIAEPAS